MDEKRMAGSYEIIHALPIGECEVVVGYDPANKDGLTYMTAFFNRNVLLEEYTNIMASPNYAETMELFAARLREQARQAKLKSQKELRDVSDNRPYDKKRCEVLDGCTLADSKTDLNGRVIIIKPEILRYEYQTAAHQLQLCTGGFGASPNARGTAVFCTNLYNGSHSRFERSDVLAVLDRKALPEWAERKLAALEKEAGTPARKTIRAKSEEL